MTTAKPRCQGWTSRREFRNNLPCGNAAQPGKPYCKLHDPELIEQRDRKRLERWQARRRHEEGEWPNAIS